MAERGTLHIVRNFHELDKSGVFDLAFTRDEGSPAPNNRVRRLFGEQELTQFLEKHLHRKSDEIASLLEELGKTGHARIPGITLPEELRDLAA